MVGAYVLININAGAGYDVLEELKKIPDVKQVHLVTGLHDIVAFVETSDIKTLTDDLMDKIRRISGINKTVTCIALP